jgi:hypothetical protein
MLSSPGTQTVNGDVDFAAGSTLAVQATGVAGDSDTNRSRLLSTSGTLTFAGTVASPFTVAVTKSGSATEATSASYTIASFLTIGSGGLDAALTFVGTNGTMTSADGTIQLSVIGFASPHTWSLMRPAGTQTLTLSFTPVPEPAQALAAAALGAGAAGWVRWRRRRWSGS